MATPLRYPDTTSFRAGFQSLIYKLDGQEFPGFVEGKIGRKRERAIVTGANADPLGKTRGKNTYEHSITVYVAEFLAFVVDHFGPGYGDRVFVAEVTITENGYDTQTHVAYGCTIDVASLEFSDGTDPLKMASIDMTPTKVLINGIDDNARPLQGPVAIG
jgi:hypothetical protein